MLCSNLNASHQIEVAKKDVGLFEGLSNTGITQKYAKFWNLKNPKQKLDLQSAYCGLGLFYWYINAGIDPNIDFSPRAAQWEISCENPKYYYLLGYEEIQKLKSGGATTFKVKRRKGIGYHVGMYDKYDGVYLYHYEANTSTARSVNSYSKKGEGVFYTKTRLNDRTIKPFSYCDCEKQGTKII